MTCGYCPAADGSARSCQVWPRFRVSSRDARRERTVRNPVPPTNCGPVRNAGPVGIPRVPAGSSKGWAAQLPPPLFPLLRETSRSSRATCSWSAEIFASLS